MDPQRRIIEDGAIAIEKDKIVYVGKTCEVRKKYKADQTIDAQGSVITPGFIDAHCHVTGEPLTKGFVPDNVAHTQLISNWFMPIYEVHSSEDEYLSTLLASIEMIKTGTTCFLESGVAKHVGSVVKAIDKVGIRGVVGRWVWDLPPEPIAYRQTTAEALKNIEQQVRKFNGVANGRVKSFSTVIGGTFCSDELLVGAKKIADQYRTIMNMHMSPIPDNPESYLKKTGKRPVQHFEQLGILDNNLVLAHMIHVSNDEISLLKKYNVKVVHCPGTALKLGYGTTKYGKFPEMLQQGICVALGCDSLNSSNYFDLTRAIYLAAGIYKDSKMDVNMIPAEQALEMATTNGAKTLSMDNEIGSIEKGKKADLVIFDRKRPEWVPMFNVVNSLVYSADGKSVDTVLIDGKVILEKGKMKTIDEFDVYEKAQHAGNEIIKRSRLPLVSKWKIE
jgi:cytosine/adenosine deaminase-related metal-dependent hydrolase